MSRKAEQIKQRYIKGYVTDEQLLRYKELGAITEEEYIEIYETKHPVEITIEAENDAVLGIVDEAETVEIPNE